MPFGSGAIGEGEAFGLPARPDPSPARLDDVSAEQVGHDAYRIAAAHVARRIDRDQVDGREQGDGGRFHTLESSSMRRHCLTSILNHRTTTDSARESIRGFGAGLVRPEAPAKNRSGAAVACDGRAASALLRSRDVRMLYMVALFCAACSCKPTSEPIEQNTANSSNGGAVRMEVYERRIAKKGEVLTPPVLLRLSGTLGERNGCLVLKNETGVHALVFEDGKASFDPVRSVLSAGSARIALGEPISVGGPFNQPSEDFDAARIKSRCDVESVWLVTGSQVQSLP